jgi:hypothetical protein
MQQQNQHQNLASVPWKNLTFKLHFQLLSACIILTVVLYVTSFACNV